MASLDLKSDGAVTRMVLNRPEVRNAFDDELIAAITAAARRLTADPSVRVVILEGAGPVFCAGADLNWMSRMVTYSRDANVLDASRLATMFQALNRLSKPLVGRVQGAALGGGAGLVAVCDIVVADDRAVFGFTEAKLGILPAVISPYVLAKVGESAARELFLTAARFPADHARDIGLVHRVVPLPEIDAMIDRVIEELLSSGPGAIAMTKALISTIRAEHPADVIGITSEAIARQRVSREGQEGMRAFLEKRKASWAAASPHPPRAVSGTTGSPDRGSGSAERGPGIADAGPGTPDPEPRTPRK
jgi:methylglutaconyl-CoA hydratase